MITRKSEFTSEQFAEHLAEEGRRATQLYAEGIFRRIFSRTDGRGAVIMIEAADEAEARKALDSLPLMKRDMLSADLYGVTAYRAFVQSVLQSLTATPIWPTPSLS